MMVILSGILALLTISLYSAFFANVCKINAALLPLPVIGAGAVWLCLWGFLGLLPVGATLFYLLAILLAAWLIWKKQMTDALQRLANPAFLIFAAMSLGFLLLFAVTQPEFVQNDEFSLWGSAAKLTKMQNVLHPAAQGNLLAKAATPGMMLMVYLFEFFTKGFSEWSAYFAYNTLLAAAVAAVAAVAAKRWSSTVILAVCGFLLPYFFTAPAPGGLSTVYLSVLGDLPLGFMFGATVAMYFALKDSKACLPVLLIQVSFLTLIKDMGLAYACIAIGLVCADQLFTGPLAGCGKRFVNALARAVILVIPVGGLYLGWSKYVAHVIGADKGTVGSGDAEMSQVDALLSGVRQLIGLEEPTEKFSQVSALMLKSPINVPVCLLGGGALALAAIFLVLAVSFFCNSKGEERRRVVVLAVFGTLALGAFLLFHLFLYVFNFKDPEALQLKDYIRYISPYYLGFFLMALALLGRAMQNGRFENLARAAALGIAAVLCVLFVWRGMPTAGFWNYPHVAYSVRDDVKARAEQVNDLLDWDDTVLLISQGDDATRWNYYGYDLNATLAKGFGGFGYREDLREGNDWWMTTHMNLVNPEDVGVNKPEVYPYQTVCTVQDMKNFLLDQRYTHILIDESDEYIANVIGPGFGLTGLPVHRTDSVILVRVEYSDDTVTWVEERGGTQP